MDQNEWRRAPDDGRTDDTAAVGAGTGNAERPGRPADTGARRHPLRNPGGANHVPSAADAV